MVNPAGGVKARIFDLRATQHQVRALRNPAFAVKMKLDMLRKIVSGEFSYETAALPALKDDLAALTTQADQELAQLAAAAFDKLFTEAPQVSSEAPPIAPPVVPPVPEAAAPESSEAVMSGSFANAVIAEAISGGAVGEINGAEIEIVTAAGTTRNGGRLSNEDAFLLASSNGAKLLAVADGVGGHAKGEVASKILINALQEAFWSNPAGFSLTSSEQQTSAIRSAHDEIIAKLNQGKQASGQAGTTVAAALIEGNEALIRHFGDSRAYVYRAGRGELELLTVDDSGAAAAQFLTERQNGRPLDESAARVLHEAGAAAKGTEAAGILQGVGLEIDEGLPLVSTTLAEGDILLLVSDGAHDYIESFERLKQTLADNLVNSPIEISRAVWAAAMTEMAINGLGRISSYLVRVREHLPPEIVAEIETAVAAGSLEAYFEILDRHRDQLAQIPRGDRTMLESLDSAAGGDNITAVAYVHGYEEPPATKEPTTVSRMPELTKNMSIELGIETGRLVELDQAIDPESALELGPRINILTGFMNRLISRLADQAKSLRGELGQKGLVSFAARVAGFENQVAKLLRQHAEIKAELERLAGQRADLTSDIEYARQRIADLTDPARKDRYIKMKESAEKNLGAIAAERQANQDRLVRLGRQAFHLVNGTGGRALTNLETSVSQLTEQREKLAAALAQLRPITVQPEAPAAPAPAPRAQQQEAAADTEGPTGVYTPPDQEPTRVADPQVEAILSSGRSRLEMRAELEPLADAGNQAAAQVLLRDEFQNLDEEG